MQPRSTNQKKIIYDYIVNSYSHPSINEIHKDLLERGEKIGIATCYRNLRALVNEGKVIQIMTNDNVAHFDYVKDRHFHLVCSCCNQIDDISIDCIQINNNDLVLKGFKTNIKNLIIYGTCKTCKEREKI